MSEVLSIRNLIGGYGPHPVLHGLDLDIGEGSLTALVGPNGHGKTTLLRAISGLLPKTSGRIALFGDSIESHPADKRARAGLVHIPQGDLLFKDLTVMENLRAGGFFLNRADLSRNIDEVFALFPRLAERRDQKAASLSGGERRMVGIGRGLVQAGRVLMIDEPSLGLAPAVIEQIYDALSLIKSEGRAIVLVEETPARIETIADSVMLIDDGCCVWQGRADALMKNHTLMAAYLGEIDA